MSKLTISDNEFEHYLDLIDPPSVELFKSYSKSKFTSYQKIAKIIPEQRNVFGWASVGYHKSGQLVVDHQGDFLDNVEEIEKAAYDFARNCGDSGTNHTGPGNKGYLIESFVTTPDKCKAMGIPTGSVHMGWWTGFHVTDNEAWDGIKKGRYRAFSVQGIGQREEVYI